MLTIYLDSSFYVALARADDGEAGEVIAALNAVDVRPVLSMTLTRELFASANRPEADARLHARVNAFARPSFTTVPHVSWDLLLLAGEPRRAFADKLAEIDRALLPAESAGVLANTTYSHGLKPAASAHTMASLGIDGDDTELIARIGEMMAPTLALIGVQVPSPLTRERLPELQAILATIIPPETMDAIARKSRLVASSVATDNRPYEVVLGTASAKARGRLAHTYRDAGHMDEFVCNTDAIDAFQMDGPQYALLTGDSEHELRRLGLADRCFTAPTLRDTVERVHEYAARVGRTNAVRAERFGDQ
jgi:hypothetical protein